VETLREEGYDVIHAADGEEALAWCRRRVADVLITDIRLPGSIDGWRIAEWSQAANVALDRGGEEGTSFERP